MADKKKTKIQYGVKVNGEIVPLRPLMGNKQSFTVRPYIALTHCIWEVFKRGGEAGVRKHLPGLLDKIVFDSEAVLKNVVNGEGKIVIAKNNETVDARFKVEAVTGIERVWNGRHQWYFIIGQTPNDATRRVVIKVPENEIADNFIAKGVKIVVGNDTIEIVKQ